MVQEFEIKDLKLLRRTIAIYLNYVEEIAYLIIKGRLPKDIGEYFQWWLKDAYAILETLDQKSINGDTFYKETWQYIIEWKKQDGSYAGTKPNNGLPLFIEQLGNLDPKFRK